MNELTKILQSARLWLESLHPAAPWITIMFGPWLAVLAVRKFLPEVWLQFVAWTGEESALSHIIQASPAVIGGAAIAALGAGGDATLAAFGALAALWSPIWHHLLKAVPWIPYLGAVGKTKRLPPTLLLVLLSLSCTVRHPERDACYLDADTQAAREYAEICGEYQDTRVCPEGDAIEARHQAAQEACK